MPSKFSYPIGDGTQALHNSAIDQANLLRELPGSVRNSLQPIIDYLTGANGVAQSTKSWGATFKGANHATITWVEWDATLDVAMGFTAPSSGSIRVMNQAYVQTTVSAYVDGTKMVTIAADTFIGFEVLDMAGTRVNTLGERSVEMHAQVYSANQATVNGATVMAMGFVSGLTPGAAYTIRTRRGYVGQAVDANGNSVAMPSESWFNCYSDPVICSINPV